MKSVRLFDYISFDADSWQVVAQDGPELALKSLTTNRIRRVPVSDLLADESYLPDAPDRLPTLDNVAVLDTLDAATREQVIDLHRHVFEVVNGVPPSDGETEIEPKDEYSLDNTLEQRIDAKIEELRRSGMSMGKSTLKRHLSAYRAKGIAGLVDGRKTRQTSVGGRTDPRVVALLEEQIAGQTNLSTGTRSRAVLRVRLQAEENGWPVPSDATLYRVLSRLTSSPSSQRRPACRSALYRLPSSPSAMPGSLVTKPVGPRRQRVAMCRAGSSSSTSGRYWTRGCHTSM